MTSAIPTPDSPWPLYAFDNYFESAGRPYPTAERWDIVKELGYDKIWFSINFTMPERVERMKRIPLDRARTGLGVIAYTIVELANPFPDSPNVFDLMDCLQSGDTVEIALTAGWKQSVSDPSLDAEAIPILQRILDEAGKRGLTVSLYHHFGFWMQEIEDCVRVAKAMNHPRLKVSFCASHWYCSHHAEVAPDVGGAIALCAPWLHLVNTCGSRPTPAGSSFPLPTTIEVFGEGTFDQTSLLRALRDHHFTGGLGFQGYGIPGDPKENLAASLCNYRKIINL